MNYFIYVQLVQNNVSRAFFLTVLFVTNKYASH